MSTTRCPGCQAALEIPAVAPGGLLECPYCETEFAVGGGGRPAGRPARGRRGGREADAYEDEGYGRRGYRRRTDPLPIIILAGAAILLLGLGVFFLVKHKEGKSAAEEAFLESIAAKSEAFLEMNRSMDAPQGDPITMYCDFRKGDLLSFKEHSYTSGLVVEDHEGGKRDLYGASWRMINEEHGEKIVSVSGDESTHEGRYQLQSYFVNGQPMIRDPVWLDASFRTGRRGNLIPGSFEVLGGATVTPEPTFIGERGFGVLPERPVRYGETWGTESLSHPFSPYIDLDGRRIEDLPLVGNGRQGGWRIQGGNFERREDGSWTRQANATLNLSAWENRRVTGGTFRGRPVRSITANVRWQGTAHYELMKNYLSRLEDVRCTVWVVVKTDRAWWEWQGTASTGYSMYKDP